MKSKVHFGEVGIDGILIGGVPKSQSYRPPKSYPYGPFRWQQWYYSQSPASRSLLKKTMCLVVAAGIALVLFR
jgi:hypothetical protein